jgi:O-antigen/teichoic acid export membrane protein
VRQGFLVLVGAMLGPAALGAFRAALTLTGIGNVPLFAAQNIIAVEAARRWAIGPAALRSYLGKVLLWGTLGLCALLAPPVAAPGWFIALLYGSSFRDAEAMVTPLAALYLLFFLGLCLSEGLRAARAPRALFVATMAGGAALGPATVILAAASAAAPVFALATLELTRVTTLAAAARRLLWKGTPT